MSNDRYNADHVHEIGIYVRDIYYNCDYAGGYEEFSHVMEVVRQVEFFGGSFRARIIAYLHDVFEDEYITAFDMRKKFGGKYATIYGDVQLLNRNITQYNETYLDYITWISELYASKKDVVLVKKADVICNLRRCLSTYTYNESLAKRYMKALQILM